MKSSPARSAAADGRVDHSPRDVREGQAQPAGEEHGRQREGEADPIGLEVAEQLSCFAEVLCVSGTGGGSFRLDWSGTMYSWSEEGSAIGTCAPCAGHGQRKRPRSQAQWPVPGQLGPVVASSAT